MNNNASNLSYSSVVAFHNSDVQNSPHFSSTCSTFFQNARSTKKPKRQASTYNPSPPTIHLKNKASKHGLPKLQVGGVGRRRKTINRGVKKRKERKKESRNQAPPPSLHGTWAWLGTWGKRGHPRGNKSQRYGVNPDSDQFSGTRRIPDSFVRPGKTSIL